MIGSPWTAVLYGAALGALSGWLSRLALKRVLRSSDKVFYSVYGAGLAARFAVVLGAVWLLRHEKYIITVLFAVSLILVQMVFEAFPLKHGTKTDT
ncbi:MAG: hypothetical protein PHV36_15015 [Elusimicrobiales bacterium]|nr:hypothetical protein [Elusimicrobiales bacterium]